MLNITNGDFSFDIWNQMIIEAANSRENYREHKNICRVIYPNRTCTLELKTEQEIKNHFRQYGYLNANCRRMALRDILNITRICSLNTPVENEAKRSIGDSLLIFASRVEEKYHAGLIGIVRKVMDVFSNLFTSDSVTLFQMNGVVNFIRIDSNSNKYKLPWFIGNDADFARLINTENFS